MSNPKAKFFCEYCDTEVPQKSIVCPKCGHFFASVRCPQCGHTGSQKEFTNGCKACGYAFNRSSTNSTKKIETPALPPKAKYKTRRNALKEIQKKETYINKKEDSLPLWVYITTISGLIVLLIILVTK